MLRKIVIGLLACMACGVCNAQNSDTEGWIPLLTSAQDLLTNWKASEREGTFKFENGELVVHGDRSHLFYVGPVQKANFKNFEFKAQVKTTPSANSGIYFHTAYQEKDWPRKGYECQVNTTHSDRKKTGGLYGVQDVIDNAPSKDGQWFDYYIKVEGKHIVIKIDGKTTVDWTEPDDWKDAGRRIDSGTFAIQGHDPKSLVYYRNIMVRPLPDDAGWISLLTSDQDLKTKWKASENQGTFSFKDGVLTVHGDRSHLFYVGPVNNAVFKDFEFTADVMTTKGSNSGIYFHTTYQDSDWPNKGYECQVNTTHSDRKKTGGLYGVQDVIDNAPSKDDQWFNYYIKVQGKHVVIKIDGKTTVDWTEPDDWKEAGRRIDQGTFAIQGHDPKSIVYYKNIKVRPIVRTVVVTGGHDFEHDPFFALFQGYEDITYVEAEQKDHSELFEDISNWDYDVIVLYNMSQNISPKRQENFKALLNKGVGLVTLHHAEGAFNTWEDYRQIIGARYPLKVQEIEGTQFAVGTYKHDMDMNVFIRDTRHPITAGMENFQIHDETYKGIWFAKDNHVLLTTDHPDSDATIGWTREYGKARVAFLQLGHDSKAYANPNYRQLIARSIRWAAGQLN